MKPLSSIRDIKTVKTYFILKGELQVTWTPKTAPALMRASLSARLGQEKPHETQTPQLRADHPQAAQCRATAQPRPNSCRCMPSLGGIRCHLPPLAASLRRHESHGRCSYRCQPPRQTNLPMPKGCSGRLLIRQAARPQWGSGRAVSRHRILSQRRHQK